MTLKLTQMFPLYFSQWIFSKRSFKFSKASFMLIAWARGTDGNFFPLRRSTAFKLTFEESTNATQLDLFLLTYLLTPWCRVLPEKLTGLQLVKNFPAFHGTRRFITALTSVRHLSLSWASPIQSVYPHPTSCRSTLILSTHLRLGLPSGLLPSGFPTKTLYTPSPHPYATNGSINDQISLQNVR